MQSGSFRGPFAGPAQERYGSYLGKVPLISLLPSLFILWLLAYISLDLRKLAGVHARRRLAAWMLCTWHLPTTEYTRTPS